VRLQTNGFTFLEILFGLLIMGIFAGIMVPRLFRIQRDFRGTFVQEFQALVQKTIGDATVSGTVHKVLFDFNQKEVRVERAQKPGFIDFKNAAGFVPTEGLVRIPPQLELLQLVIDGRNEIDAATTQSWFFVDFMGNVQPVSFVLVQEGEDVEVTYATNPFSGMLEQKT